MILGIVFRFGLVAVVASLVASALVAVPGYVGSWLVQLGIQLGQTLEDAGSAQTGVLREALRSANDGFLMVAPIATAVAVRTYLQEPIERITTLLPNPGAAVGDIWGFVLRGKPRFRALAAFLKPGLYVAAFCFLAGWYAAAVPQAVGEETIVKPAYVVWGAEPQTLLPVHLLVHFDNASIDEDGQLVGNGVAVDESRQQELRATVETLRECATDGSEVVIAPYGFASDDEFRGLPEARSDMLNVETANRRGRAVEEVLAGLAGERGDVTVKAPVEWNDLATMVGRRNSMIRVPEGKQRNAFADRVALVMVADAGRCRMAGEWVFGGLRGSDDIATAQLGSSSK